MDLCKDRRSGFWSSLILASAAACTVARFLATAHGMPLSSVTIWNYVGEPILVHCHDQFTDLVQRRVPHDSDFVFTFYQNPDNTTLYTCAFVWGPNSMPELPVWEGAGAPVADPAKRCGNGTFKCSYKVTKEGLYLASSAASGNKGGLANWLFVSPWAAPPSLKD